MGLSAIWKKKLYCNRQVIARGEADCNLSLLRVQFFFNCTKKMWLLINRRAMVFNDPPRDIYIYIYIYIYK